MAQAVKAGNPKRLRQQGVALLRKARLLPLAEWTRLQLVTRKFREENEAFMKEQPDFFPPPIPVMHDAFSNVSYRAYFKTGTNEAGTYAALIKKHHRNPERVLEWGCGPARVLRHLPEMLPGVKFYGTDYNKDSIEWGSKALPNISFALCGLAPPLPFVEKFDVIYGISVITHLSVAQQEAWITELTRALAPGGILILTTHGHACAHVLLPQERATFDAGGVIIRSGVIEGSRCYTSYHHPDYVRGKLFKGLEVLEHIEHNPSPYTDQDIWVLKVKS